jgi:hypothetical protein
MAITLPRRVKQEEIILLEPTYLQAIIGRHPERVEATKDCISLKFTNLHYEKVANVSKISNSPTNCALLKEMHEINDKIACCKIKLKDKIDMKLTNAKKMAHSYAWQTHRKTTESLKKSRGKAFSLILGQCTQVLVDKMMQDADWIEMSKLFDPTLPFKLVEKFVLKQLDNQNKTAVLIAEQLSIYPSDKMIK